MREKPRHPIQELADQIRDLPYPYVGTYDLDSPEHERGWRDACATAAKVIERRI